MKFVFASDSFKGSLTSEKTIELLGRAAAEVFGPVETAGVPVADGGEGTTETVIRARHGEKHYVDVHGPLMEDLTAFYGQISDTEAILEMAQASGLPLVPVDRRDPRKTTTFGTGELLKAALDAGYRDISIAIGGSATNDGGMGFARALGVRFLDAEGRELDGCGADLIRVEEIDLSGLDPRISESHITAMCDVTNPLTGPDGATHTFGLQKGATTEILEELETGMQHYREVLIRTFDTDPDSMPGSGAAGGLGAALLLFMHAELRSGIETVLDLIHFDELLEGADLVITGEGRADWQSAFGKVLQGVGDRAAGKGIPAIALCGGLGPGYDKIYEHGIVSLMTTVPGPVTLEDAILQAEKFYYESAVRMFRLVKAGMCLGRH